MRTARSQLRSTRVIVVLVVVAAFGATAGAVFASELPNQVSTNWAGYAAITSASTRDFAKRFTSASGSWVQPAATCVPGEPTFSAFWVGLGGYKQNSKALEQIGSEADCSASGQVSYYAWYEFVPRGPETIHRIAVSPGDTIAAKVKVKRDHATVSLADLTSGKTFTYERLMRSPQPDVSAADWIAEAPSNCDRNTCTPLTLTNFGSVSFTSATASSVGIYGRQTGAIDDPDWVYGAINLQSGASQQPTFSHREPSSASVGLLGSTGNAFTVTYTGGEPATGSTGLTGITGTSGSTGAT